ncbi:SUMF1/EgtB/PvdO family nonheme iron enzyme [Pseudarthrobacter sp. PS3-L1]|uniref:formylglycine-generating enzyme family protein n=1 Tax=Pseudarthrobacter sp. PS3-L1 TaxID=3046207 RepID=UPI0024B92EB7|nr:SUMF1/EgtB/PvdO family nonheme iron enzyme [Pseudarthrobacter sp. PS3-L1]MDJ0319893.1 SUMF1/EgtB/PvdO family nonheme iron enzyme [Pseudarthrobacter sp. PS3-L1]
MSLFDLRLLPAGHVELHDARRQRRWTVDLEPFEIGAVPVTTAQYAQVMGSDRPGSQLPLAEISWVQAINFCNAASIAEGLAPTYTFEEGEVTWRTGAPGYRLATEAEWEYACRAGTAGPHYGALDAIAWTANDKLETTKEVGLKQANDFGLHDTLGNVWEWCWDLLDPARYGDYRAFRGGGFADKHWSVRASTRRGGGPGITHPDLGLRLARGAFGDPLSAQGWSAEVDSERGKITGMLPTGWTPRQH